MIGEIKRFIRDDGPIKVSRSLKELTVKIRELQKEYIIKKGRDITKEEIQKELKVSKEDINLAMESSTAVESIDNVMYTNNKDGNSIKLIERISTDTNEEELIANKITITQLINELQNREKELILLRYYRGQTQSQVAKILGITQVQVSRIERKILNDMKVRLSI